MPRLATLESHTSVKHLASTTSLWYDLALTRPQNAARLWLVRREVIPAFEFDVRITESPLDETPRENWATWIGIISTIIPATIVSGFMPDWNVLPYNGWLAIAAIGSAIAGAIAPPPKKNSCVARFPA